MEKKKYQKIRHFLEYAIFFLFIKLIKLLHIDRSADITSYCAGKIGPLLKVNRLVKYNLNNILTPDDNHDLIIKKIWNNFGRFIGEFPHVKSLTSQEINKRIKILGLENLTEFQQKQQPFLLFTGHFANWDFAIKILTKLYPKFAVVYRSANNPLVNKIINDFRLSSNVKLIPKGPKGSSALVKALKGGYSIAMLVDQRMNDGIEVPFLGKPAMTAPAIAKLSRKFNYPIIPCQIIRKNGTYFEVVIHPPLRYSKSTSEEQDCYNIMLQINVILEGWIREYPEQWFWFHNRWGVNLRKIQGVIR